jgi:hypothetical protein
MSTPNQKEDIAIEQTLSNAYIRMKDMLELQAELDPNADSALIIPRIRAQVEELSITPRMIENPPLKYILGFRDKVTDILELTENSVKVLEKFRNFPQDDTARRSALLIGRASIAIQITSFDFILIQMEAMAKYRHAGTVPALQRYIRTALHFYGYILKRIFWSQPTPSKE